MTSILKADNIQDADGNNIINERGNTITIGASGDTISIPSGATIANSGTATGFGETNTPYFEAYQSSNTGYLTNNTYIKVQCNTEVVDSAGAYDSTTNYRFTPQTAGKYFIYGNVRSNANGNSRLRDAYAVIYLNGSRYRESRVNFADNYTREANIFTSALITMNGSSDYVELYGAVNDSSGSNQGYFAGSEGSTTNFGGYLVSGT